MASPFQLNRNELAAVKELEMRFRDKLPPNQKEDPTLFYRFLKARDFDVDKAEIMLRKNLAWRKAFQVDTILESFTPKEVSLKYLGGCVIGQDKEGNVIRYFPIGKLSPRDIERSLKLNDFMKHYIWLEESDIHFQTVQNMKTGSSAYQDIFIFNLDGLTVAAATSKLGINFFLRLIHIFQDNYPERMKYVFVINAPTYYTVFFAILKKVMSNATIEKIRILGQTGWKEALLQIIDADVLPAFLGGKRTDPDGDPSCKTFVLQGGRIPSKYFLTEEERYFRDVHKIKSIVVPAGTDHKMLVDVNTRGSVISWEFETKSKDIGFGLFYKQLDDNLEEVLPIQWINTDDGTETGSYKCESKGTYVIIFDNSHSWLNSKKVRYCITVE